MIQEQTALPIEAITAIHHIQEAVQVHQRHVRMHILDIRLQQRILQRHGRQAERTLGEEVAHILGSDLGRQRTDEGRQLGGSVVFLKRREELGGARGVSEERWWLGAGVGPVTRGLGRGDGTEGNGVVAVSRALVCD